MNDGLYYRTFGTGPEPALMVHCGLGQSAMWKGVCASLADQVTVTAPDLPSHGRSPDWDTAQDVHDCACAGVGALLGAGQTHLVGHSFGATVALRLALEAPERVASLTLIEPVMFAAAKGRDAYAPHRQAEDQAFAALADGDAMEAARRFNQLWGGGVDWDSLRPQVQEDMAARMGFVVATEPSLWQDCHGLLAPGRLEALQCPVTFVRGTQTVPIIRDVHVGLMARLGQSSEDVIDGAGHMLVMSHAGQVAEAIQKSIGSASPIHGIK